MAATSDLAPGPVPERRLRIIHCFRNPIGGLFRHVRDLCSAQAAAGHAVGIICDSTTGGPFEEALLAELAPRLSLGLQRVPMERRIAFSDLAGARRVLAAAKPLSPDVLHGHGAKGGAYSRIGGTALAGIWSARSPHLHPPRR